MWSAIGEIIFTVVVGYMGAIELLFVAKQLFHLAFQHQRRQMLLADDSGLRTIQERIDRELIEATNNEILGYNAMKDGVLYKDGFRIDPEEINDHETPHRQISEGTKTGRVRSKDLSESVTEKTSTTTSETEIRQEVIEEPCIKMVVKPREVSPQKPTADCEQPSLTQSVKTQFGQKTLEEYTPAIQSETPVESQNITETLQEAPQLQSSPLREDISIQEYQREEPEGQDVSEPQYSDDYLRSLDGIKNRPLVRDDGTRRRRAFRKRNSSGSTSSRESRTSREEELKMFTSLEEEEFESIKRGDSDYVPIKYSNDPNPLKSGKHHRRHRKSPMKETKRGEGEDVKGSLEMLDEEGSSPWGDVVPEHYKDSEFWKREKAVSIEEESDENAPSLRGENIEKQQAEELTAPPTPTKNIPKLSSFEEATHSQHHEAVSTLTKQISKNEAKKSSEKDVEKVSNTPLQSEAHLEGVLVEQKPSAGTEETIACGEVGENAPYGTGLRRSPRLDDIDRYEERLREEDENAKVRPLSPSRQTPANSNKLKSPQLTEPQTYEAQAGSEKLSPSPAKERLRNVSPYKTGDRPQTPVIEVIRIDDKTENTSKLSNLLEGVSDFYDFNASINPSRSPSRERSLQRSIIPTERKSPFIETLVSTSSIRQTTTSIQQLEEKDKTRSYSPSRQKSPLLQILDENSRNKIPFDTKDLSGLSGFYDFCVMMNQHAYGWHRSDRASAHRTSTDYLEAKLRAKKSRSKSPYMTVSMPKNGVASLPETGGGTRSQKTPTSLSSPLSSKKLKDASPKKDTFYTASTPLETPETPEFQRSFSANMRYLEQMKDEYRTNAFKRSTYVGESMDFENDFEELRERTRLFQRSRSRSPSPLLDDRMDPCTSKQAAQRELQERILEEITRTTINYQDFSRDINQKLIDSERRGSDSALLQNADTIQIHENLREKVAYTDEDILNELEGEEYHHFRRFSLNLESQEEQYPDDNDCVYLEQIYVQTETGSRSWIRQDFYDKDYILETEPVQGLSSSTNITEDDSDRAEADDIDSESEDDRQTVVEVDDEIDEDVFDYERVEEQSNEQSECEEADREMDRYAHKNADDWNDEETTGFALPTDNKLEDDYGSIETEYDTTKDIEESGIEKDYDVIAESINENEILSRNSVENENSQAEATHDLLDESIRIDQMYNDALENTEESGIEKDYENIIAAINKEGRLSQNSLRNRNSKSTGSNNSLDEIVSIDQMYKDVVKDIEESGLEKNYGNIIETINKEERLSRSPVGKKYSDVRSQDLLEESISIDQIYNDVIKDTEESGIEKDYENIVEAMNEEERLSQNSAENKESSKSDNLLDEILTYAGKRNIHRSPGRDKIRATLDFINNEITTEMSNKNTVISVTTSSTRLRSRYGYGPAILHRDYDDLDDLNVDINYKPKKKYKWRENFKLDDDDSPVVLTEPVEDQGIKNSNSYSSLENAENGEEFEKDESKLLSQMDNINSPEGSNHLDSFYEGNDENNKSDCITPNLNDTSKGAIKKQRVEEEENKTNITKDKEEEAGEGEALQYFKNEEVEKASRKKKTKRRSRRGSKVSIGHDEDPYEATSPHNDENKEPEIESGLKKKPKRKKKILEAITAPIQNTIFGSLDQNSLKSVNSSSLSMKNLKSPSPPQPDALLNTKNLQPHTKTLSHSPAKSPPPASNSSTPNSQALEQFPETSKTPVHLTATTEAEPPKSKSRSPDPATSHGPASTRSTSSPRSRLERIDSSNVFELIKDGSMYPLF